MAKGKVIALYISPTAGGQMQKVNSIEAIAGSGLKGDRYCTGEGSFNKERRGHRQITLINSLFFKDTDFDYADSRRNIITLDVELMCLIGREFQIGNARMRGVKYCDPCNRPSKLSGNNRSFKEVFFDRGGLVAEILESGVIMLNSEITPPPKNY